MCLLCVLPDVCSIFDCTVGGFYNVCSIFDCTVGGFYIMLVRTGDIIVDASTVIGGTRFIRIPILVDDLFVSIGRICLLFSIEIGLISSFVRLTYILTNNICI